MSNRKIFLCGIILFYLFNGIYSIHHLSITFDEGRHYSYGKRVIKGDPERYNSEQDNSKMPISAINTLPRVAEQIYFKGLVKKDNGRSDIVNGRYITLLFSVLTILLVYKWARQLYGPTAGLFAAVLMSICPNNLANAVLVTTDAYSSFFLLACMYFFWRFCNSSSVKDFIWLSAALAVSQLAKQSLAHVYIIVLTGFIIYWLASDQKVNWPIVLKNTLLMIVIGWLIINAGFLFYKPFMQLGDYHFMSHFFLQLHQILPAHLPVPMSKAFITGLDMAKYYDEIGGGRTGTPESSFGNVNILGQSRTGGGFWYYYFVSFFYKTPIPVLILMVWTFYYFVRKTNKRSFFKNELFLFLPVVYFLVLFNFFYNTQCGIRHIIFIYPLLFIFISGLVRYITSVKQKFLLFLSSLYLVISVLFYYKNYFAYTNEFIVNKTNGYRIVGSSNINFNQGYFYLKEYLKEHPEVRYAPATAEHGKFVVMLDEFLDVWNTHKYSWLSNYQPSDNVANGCYLIFDIK
jgi:hypothetical protein